MTNTKRFYVCLNAIFEEASASTTDNFCILMEVQKTFDFMMNAYKGDINKEVFDKDTYNKWYVLMVACYRMATELLVEFNNYDMESIVSYYQRKIIWLKGCKARHQIK